MKEYNNGFSSERGVFKLAEKSKVNRNFIWFSILAYLLALTGGGVVGIGTEIGRLKGGSPFWMTFIDLTIGFGMVSLLVYLIVRFREGRAFKDIGFQAKGGKNYLKGFGIGAGLMVCCIVIMMATGGMQMVFRLPNSGLQTLPFVVIILLGWIVQGGTEEVLTRGWMLPLMGRKYNVPVAIIMTSIFFMLLHSSNDNMTLMPIINLILFGVFAALYVVHEGNLWGICGMHSAWNWMQGNVLGIAVSGKEPVGGSLFKFVPRGNNLLSGGLFGVEGSVVFTVVFALASLYLLYRITNIKE